MMQKYALLSLLATIAIVVAPVTSSTCTSFAVDAPAEMIQWAFGLQDSIDGSTPYSASLTYNYYSIDDQIMKPDNSMYFDLFHYWINSVVLYGTKNWTNYDSARVPTANFTCTSDHSGIWGPAYADARYDDYDIRAQFQNLEAYVHSSAPNQTSYIRSILFVKNIGSTVERATTNGDWYLNNFGVDFSPVSNKGRYAAV